MPLTSAPPRLYFEDRGAGDPLLVIGGFAVSSAVLRPITTAYANELRCISYDHPGTGRSSRRAFPVTTAQLAASAVGLLDDLGVDAAHVAGLSLGGTIAQELALRFPDRVRGLILMATSTSGPLSVPPDPLRCALAAARVARDGVRLRRLQLGPAVFSDAFLEREPQLADDLLAPMSQYPATPWGIAGQFLAAGLHDRALDLHRIRAPTLVLHGERDMLVPLANAHRLADGIPDAELHVFPGAGHGFVLEHLDATRAIVCGWLARRQPAAGRRPTRGAVRGERLTRQLAVPLGGLRVGRSTALLATRAFATRRQR